MRMSREQYEEIRGRAKGDVDMPALGGDEDDSGGKAKKRDRGRRGGRGGGMAEGIFQGVGRAGVKAAGAVLGGFTGKGRFKGIKHPDDLIDDKTKWLYVPRHGKKRRRSMKELYFGQKD